MSTEDGHVVVDDVGELFDIEATGGHVGGDEQVGGPAPKAPHHPVPLLLAHPTMQGLGAVAAAVERLGEAVHGLTGSAEHERRGGDSTSRIRPRAAALWARWTT